MLIKLEYNWKNNLCPESFDLAKVKLPKNFEIDFTVDKTINNEIDVLISLIDKLVNQTDLIFRNELKVDEEEKECQIHFKILDTTITVL